MSNDDAIASATICKDCRGAGYFEGVTGAGLGAGSEVTM